MTTNEIVELADLISAKLMATTKKVLSFDDVAILTGLSKSHLYKLTSANLIPHFKPNGKLVYFDRAEIENWMLTNRVATADEISQLAQTYLNTNSK